MTDQKRKDERALGDTRGRCRRKKANRKLCSGEVTGGNSFIGTEKKDKGETKKGNKKQKQQEEDRYQK
jgi:hypothetical protein